MLHWDRSQMGETEASHACGGEPVTIAGGAWESVCIAPDSSCPGISLGAVIGAHSTSSPWTAVGLKPTLLLGPWTCAPVQFPLTSLAALL